MFFLQPLIRNTHACSEIHQKFSTDPINPAFMRREVAAAMLDHQVSCSDMYMQVLHPSSYSTHFTVWSPLHRYQFHLLLIVSVNLYYIAEDFLQHIVFVCFFMAFLQTCNQMLTIQLIACILLWWQGVLGVIGGYTFLFNFVTLKGKD